VQRLWMKDQTICSDIFNTANPAILKLDLQPIPHILLHLIHPSGLTTLHSLLTHVKRFRSYLGSLSTTAENAQIAKDVLVDLVDCSGIDLLKLEPLLTEFVPVVQALDSSVLRQCLICCRPMPALRPTLQTLTDKMSSSQVVDKPRLFIKPSDLIDGISKVSLTSNVQVTGVDKERDIISKGVLSRRGKELVCSRCGGISEKKLSANTGNITGHISKKWDVWEKIWSFKCICGGLWQSAQTPWL